MYDNFGEAVLGDEAGTGTKRGGEDRTVLIDHVVGWFASEGQYEVMVQARAPVTRE